MLEIHDKMYLHSCTLKQLKKKDYEACANSLTTSFLNDP